MDCREEEKNQDLPDRPRQPPRANSLDDLLSRRHSSDDNSPNRLKAMIRDSRLMEEQRKQVRFTDTQHSPVARALFVSEEDRHQAAEAEKEREDLAKERKVLAEEKSQADAEYRTQLTQYNEADRLFQASGSSTADMTHLLNASEQLSSAFQRRLDLVLQQPPSIQQRRTASQLHRRFSVRSTTSSDETTADDRRHSAPELSPGKTSPS